MGKYFIEHIGIAADDTHALADWYSRVLGFREFFRTDDEMPTIFMQAGYSKVATASMDASEVMSTSIEIFARKSDESKPAFMDRTGMHLAILVDDFEAAVTDLEAHGVIFLGETRNIFAGGKVRFFTDPEGNRLHIVHRPVRPW
ncbi:MAG: VOC family protein [Spirochaetaceae bacterium]|nr:VOC family protein [Spirochaetaceae bacterium]